MGDHIDFCSSLFQLLSSSCPYNCSFVLVMWQSKTLRCSLSETKNRLFIGNIPKTWTEDEFRKIVENIGPGVDSIELIKVILSNGGFVF